MNLSAAWDETAAFARREARLLFPLAFLCLALPAAIVQAAAPVTALGAAPRPGLWLAALPVLLCASLIGALAISALALGRAPRAAFGVAMRRFPALLGAAVPVLLGGSLLMLSAALSVYALLAALPLMLFFWVRLILLTPAAAAGKGGPIALIRRSWALTGGHFWPLLGFVLLAIVVSLVVLIAAGAIGGLLVTLVLGRPEPGSAAMLLTLLGAALLQAVIGGLFTAFVARLYAQLA
jgi:hypothetical protein